MFQIVDSQDNTTVKSRFLTVNIALEWAKENLEPHSCAPWGKHSEEYKYYIEKY